MAVSENTNSFQAVELSKISNHELLNRMAKLVRTERKITHLILCHINEVETRRLYADLGFDSMFKYLTAYCGYGEDSAYRRLQAARLLKKTPIIAEKLEEGSLNLTQLTQVQKCIKQEIKAGITVSSTQTLQILEQIQNKSSYETQKVLAVEFSQPIQTNEIVRPQRDQTVRLELTLTEEQMNLLREAQAHLSHAVPDGNLAEVISFLTKGYLQKIRGQKVKELQKKIHEKNEEKVKKFNFKEQEFNRVDAEGGVNKNLTPSFMAKRKRSPIKISDRRVLLSKARGCCEYISMKTNLRCRSIYQLQIDHKIPLALGGSDHAENLRVLCRTHNLLEAQKWGVGRVLVNDVEDFKS